MLLNLSPSEDADAVGRSVARFRDQAMGDDYRSRRQVAFSRDLWSALAELGVFTLRIDGQADLIAAAACELGRGAFPGPLAATMWGVHALDAARAGALEDGTALIALGPMVSLPWAPVADLHVAVDALGAAIFKPTEIAPFETLAAEPWGQCRGEVSELLATDRVAAGFAAYDLTLAAYLVGAGLELIQLAAAHAGQRRQFGRTLGEFQAVSFPLARTANALDAAEVLVSAAAAKLNGGAADGGALAIAARISAGRAARNAAYAAHQTLGAYGVTEEGPVTWMSRRIQQACMTPPDERQRRREMPLSVVSALQPA